MAGWAISNRSLPKTTTLMKNIITIIFLLGLCLCLSSCSEEDLKQSELTANAGLDQTVLPFTTVTLDGTASIGESINYEWTYNSGPMSSSELFLNNAFTANPTFEPTKNGVYFFTLEVTSGVRFSEDQVQITVSGAITLGGTLAQSLELKDFEPNPTLPDYIISTDLTIPDGVTLRFPSSGSVVVNVTNNSGIVIQAGGALNSDASFGHTITAPSGWKGILVDGGRIEISSITIEKAGSAAFSGQSEAAAITLAGILPNIAKMSNVIFLNSASYDLLVATATGSSTLDNTIISNSFSFSIPIKAPISFLPKISSNSYPESYEYIHLIPSGAGTIDAVSGGFIFPPGAKCFIDGDFTSASQISIQNAIVLMKAGAGILSQGGLTISSSTISGLNGAGWRGIAFTSSSSQMVISSSVIEDAGSEVFNTGFFSTPAKAAIYFNGNSNAAFSSTEIANSGGYGVYIDAPSNYVSIQSSTFESTSLPAIRVRVDQVQNSIKADNSFSMTNGIPAVEVQVPNLSTTPIGTWNSLGGTNYYLMSNSVMQSGGSWTLSPGVNIKFKAGKFMYIEQGSFTAIGTSLSPITFDSETGSSGTWAGILIESLYKFEFCQIKNGGETNLLKGNITPATEKANIVFNYGGISTANTFKNNIITGSAGYGLLVEATKQNPDALNVANNNTFSNNTSGNVIVK